MYRKSIALLAAYGALIFFFSSCQQSKNTSVESSVTSEVTGYSDDIFVKASNQYREIKNHLPTDQFPRAWYEKERRMETSGSEWWCSGFYPGTLLNLYEETEDEELYTEAVRMLELLEKEQYNTTTHDLGFMMFCSFGKANTIAPKEEYNKILLNSAHSLASRFNPKIGAIRSWDSDPKDFLVIIDNMMNLELLFWATKEIGDSSFYKIAITHANTTIKNHFRPDNSSYHVLNYDPETGEIKEKKTAQGYADESAWARGQAWGLYGFTATYRETAEPKYLEQAIKIADFMLNHPNMPINKVPYWDFNAPDIPNALRDASAAAITASALFELSTYVENEKRQQYYSTAETILETLSSPQYLAEQGSNGGFLLKHGVGHLPQNSEVDVPLTYADYYFIEALKRYKYYK